MAKTSCEADNGQSTIRPHLGIGWQTIVDQAHGEVTMQYRLFCLGLPFKRRIPHSDVVRVAAISRESWWSRAGGYLVFPRNLASSGVGTRVDRTPMPTKGWRYDILMTLKSGKTIKIETVKSLHTAKEMELLLRAILGLPEIY